MNRLPEPSTATPLGQLRLAPVAGPPSPENRLLPFPAIVVMTPVAASTRRMRLLPWSPMNRLPEPSTATPIGPLRLALVAGPRSPWNRSSPPPATVVIVAGRGAAAAGAAGAGAGGAAGTGAAGTTGTAVSCRDPAGTEHFPKSMVLMISKSCRISN